MFAAFMLTLALMVIPVGFVIYLFNRLTVGYIKTITNGVEDPDLRRGTGPGLIVGPLPLAVAALCLGQVFSLFRNLARAIELTIAKYPGFGYIVFGPAQIATIVLDLIFKLAVYFAIVYAPLALIAPRSTFAVSASAIFAIGALITFWSRARAAQRPYFTNDWIPRLW